MPARLDAPASRRREPWRVLASSLALVMLLTIGVAETPPTAAANWSRQIGATRASQLYYEGAMRAADRQIAGLKRARKQTQKRLKQARHALTRARQRADASKERLVETRGQLRAARWRLQGAESASAFAAARAATDEAAGPAPSAWPALIGFSVARMASAATIAAEGGASGAGAADEASEQMTSASPPSTTMTAALDAAADAVHRLERTERLQRRSARKHNRQLRRTMRMVQARTRSLAAIRRNTAAAISRREGAEAALGSRILSMSTLARRRAEKQTKVRPGVSSAFAWPARGRISQGYGCTGFRLNPSRGSCGGFHDGLDIVSYLGSPVRAAAVGVVSFVGWNPWDQHGRAFMVVVAHPGGYETLYGHLQPTRRVRVGQLVRRGEVVGSMGNTGRTTGAHLHFELRRGRTTLNPLSFL